MIELMIYLGGVCAARQYRNRNHIHGNFNLSKLRAATGF